MREVPTGPRILGAVGRALITAGVVVLLFVVFQLWGTNLQEARAQNGLRSEFDATIDAAQAELAVLDAGSPTDDVGDLPSPVTTTTLPGGFTEDLLRLFFPDDGDAVARIEIPSIGVDKIVVRGVQVADLRKGPGQYPGTATAGTTGNTSIAGHRTTYGAPFNRIDELEPGDEIHVTGVLGRFTYRVMDPQEAFAVDDTDTVERVDSFGDGHIIVRPSATWVLGDFDDDRVTLTACHPKLSSRQRIIVAAELVDEPVASPEFDADVVAAFMGDADSPQPTIPGEALPDTGDIGTSNTVDAVNGLDEGLDGEREAIPGAVLWLLAATVIWVAAGYLARALFADRGRRLAVRLAGLGPAAACLWFSFEMIDRALPAG